MRRMEREPYTYPFTEAEMQEIEAKAAERKAWEDANKISPVSFWIVSLVYAAGLTWAFTEPMDAPWWMVFIVTLFPATGAAWLTLTLLPKPKTP